MIGYTLFEGHTPGPWEFESTNPTPQFCDQLVKAVDGDEVAWAYRQSDAHLIAAAPELLAENKRLRDQLSLALTELE